MQDQLGSKAVAAVPTPGISGEARRQLHDARRAVEVRSAEVSQLRKDLASAHEQSLAVQQAWRDERDHLQNELQQAQRTVVVPEHTVRPPQQAAVVPRVALESISTGAGPAYSEPCPCPSQTIIQASATVPADAE